MRKRMIRVAVFGCIFALSLAPMSVNAAPKAEQITEVDAEDTRKAGGTGEADGTAVSEITSTNENIVDTGGQEWKTAEHLRAKKDNRAFVVDMMGDTSDREKDPDAKDSDMEDGGGEEKLSYTAPEDSRHANVSFSFEQASASAYFSKLAYPLTLSLKEIDTGDRIALTVKSEGQILEVEKGDYAVTSIKDSGRVPLSVAGDTLHIYDNTEYSVRFAANNALKMFTNFLADNVFLVCFFAFAALFYKKVIISKFANDARRR